MQNKEGMRQNGVSPSEESKREASENVRMKASKEAQEKDDFWNIDALLPPRKEQKAQENVPCDTKLKIIEVERAPRGTAVTEVVRGSALSRDNEESARKIVRFIPPYTKTEHEPSVKPELEYFNNNTFIKCVRVYDKSSKYENLEDFYATAIKLWRLKGVESPRIPFFSYSPQYSQLNRAQLSWYAWWRENFRNGIYLDTDYSYILLYVYEIINLSAKLKKEYCIEKLCDVWINYGERFEFIGRYLCEWICDFCLINRMSPPADRLKKLYPFIFKNALLKEFYMFGNGDEGIDANMLMAVSSTYDYTKSRYATGERRIDLKKTIKAVLEHLIKRNYQLGGTLFGFGLSNSKVTRIAYSGALCANHARKKIEVEYRAFSRSHELRYLIADVMRYTENKLRASWGVRSRLSIYALPTNIRALIDEYFDKNPIKKKNEADGYENGSKNEYDRLYDSPSIPLSLSRANEIEEDSWKTTKILVEAFESGPEDTSDAPAVPEAFEQIKHSEDPRAEAGSEESAESELKRVLGKKYEFLLAVLNFDIRLQRSIAIELSDMPEAIVDEINEISADILGDVIIEEDDNGGYRVIEEYRGVIK